MSKFYTKLISGILTAAIGVTMLTLSVFAEDTNASKTNIWVAGDFHTHTNLSDGRYSAAAVAKKAFETYGLDWYSAADHGGGVKGTRFDDGSARKTVMPRWESIVGEGTDKVLANRLAYSQKLQFNGFEWNVPEHEHASVGMVGEDSTVRKMLSAFDYMYDGEKETENAVFKNFLDYHQANSKHDNAAQAASWLQAEFTKTSYILPNHVSRRLQFDIAALRDLNNAAPDVNFGFEGLPGHQKSSYRGGYAYISYYDKTAKKVFSYHIDQKDAYGSRLFFSAQDVVNKFIADADLANNAVKGTSNPAAVRDSAEAIIKAITLDTIQSQRTWGGADYMVAKVGGVWDAMLREGRKYFVFGNSDFHVNDVLKEGDEPDFWPGEYSKNYTAVTEKTYQGILDGMRSGKTYIVLGDLISDLDYSVTNDKKKAEMGETLECTEDKEIVMTIKFKKPDSNHNTYGGSNQPVIDHIDLIAGEVGGVIYPFDENPNYDVADPNSGSAAVVNPQYSNPNCPEGTVKVIKTFTSSDWGTKDKDGYYSITYKLAKTDKSMYYRLRGTNLAKGTPGQTDLNGNPLCDQQFQWLGDTSSAISTNNGAKAFEDLWFYSNPIFVQKQQ